MARLFILICCCLLFTAAGAQRPDKKLQKKISYLIQGFHGDLALVAMLDRLDGFGAPNDRGKGGLEGWIRKDFLSPKDGQP